MARAGSQRVIQMNDDSIAFYKYCITERPTAEDLEDMVDVFAEANADTLTLSTAAGRRSTTAKWLRWPVSSRRRQCGPGESTHYWPWHACLRRDFDRRVQSDPSGD